MKSDRLSLIKEDIKENQDIETGVSVPESENHVVEHAAPEQSEVRITPWQIAHGLAKLVFSKENSSRVAASLTLSSVGTVFNFISPALLAESIRALSADNETVKINNIEFTWPEIVSALVISYGFAQIIPNICNQIITPVTANNIKKIIEDSTKHLLAKNLHYHVNTVAADKFFFIQKGFSLSTIGTPLLSQVLPMMIQILVAASLISSQYGIELGASLMVLFVLYVGYSALTAKAVIKENDAMLAGFNESYEQLMATIERYKIIHDYGHVKLTLEDLDKVLNRVFKEVFVKANAIPIKISYGHTLISYTHMLLAALYVGNGIKSGKYTVQDFVIVVGYLLQLANLMPAFGQAINQLFSSYPDLKFVFKELANKTDKMDDPLEGEEFPLIPESAPSIEFSDVTYSHRPRPNEENPPILFKNLSCTIKANKLTAIVSESGVGKTTLFHLLTRYYPLTTGRGNIKVNNQDINTINLESLRRNIAVFYRDPQLFKGSLRDNIAFGAANPKAVTDQDIEELATQANLFEFIQGFPQKLDTIIGPGGSTLSDGQQQKVAILRGLMKKSSLWLLDEITSALDAESATQILEAIRAASENTTILMITHKLHEVAQYADEILVIDKNSNAAQGQHEQLLNSSELYLNLWQKYTSQSTSNEGKSSTLGVFALKSNNSNLRNRNKVSDSTNSHGLSKENNSVYYEI